MSGIGRLAHSSRDDGKVKQVHACKYLHLGSEHNALAKACEDYIKKSGGGLVQVNYFTDLTLSAKIHYLTRPHTNQSKVY